MSAAVEAARPLLNILSEGRELPEGTDRWAMRSVHLDLTSSRGYRWPFPGQWAEAPGPIVEANTGPCPGRVGDGLCVALTPGGMATGGVPALAVLLCAVANSDVLGLDAQKLRVRRALVVELIDLPKMARDANLSDAYLSGANLSGAYLYGAYLYGANLSDADLYGANLYGANLSGADLYGANLSGANLSGANLSGANLSGANLYGANLSGADLYGANLYGANLSGAIGVER